MKLLHLILTGLQPGDALKVYLAADGQFEVVTIENR